MFTDVWYSHVRNFNSWFCLFKLNLNMVNGLWDTHGKKFGSGWIQRGEYHFVFWVQIEADGLISFTY